ncbi:MAG: 6-phosphofructokinase [Alphaproteobacteria bacterium]
MPDFLVGSKNALKTDAANGDLFDCTPHVMAVVASLGIDALIAIGDDDTLSYAAYLHEQGLRVVSIPKTMDNDVFGTDYCIDLSTAITPERRCHHRPADPHGQP